MGPGHGESGDLGTLDGLVEVLEGPISEVGGEGVPVRAGEGTIHHPIEPPGGEPAARGEVDDGAPGRRVPRGLGEKGPGIVSEPCPEAGTGEIPTMLRTRSGASATMFCATLPPMEWPTTEKVDHPR